jgi:hypothetical protein
MKTLKFGGAVEGMDFAKVNSKNCQVFSVFMRCISAVCACLQDSDIIVIGVREDNYLHCYDLSSDKLEEVGC